MGRVVTKSTSIEHSVSRARTARGGKILKRKCDCYYDPIREKRREINTEED